MERDQIRYTVADYLEIVALPENANKRVELIDGMIEEMAPSGNDNTVIAARFMRHLGAYVDDNNLGLLSGADGGYSISSTSVLIPDAAFISWDRNPDPEGKVFGAAPNLAVEVISPSETAADVKYETRRYLEAGTKAVWNVYPKSQEVDVHTLNADGTITITSYTRESIITGGDALPGFELDLSTVFLNTSP
ncbi:MAG: Uma2 family endonuclease [Chloroflexota bacterium]